MTSIIHFQWISRAVPCLLMTPMAFSISDKTFFYIILCLDWRIFLEWQCRCCSRISIYNDDRFVLTLSSLRQVLARTLARGKNDLSHTAWISSDVDASLRFLTILTADWHACASITWRSFNPFRKMYSTQMSSTGMFSVNDQFAKNGDTFRYCFALKRLAMK